MGYWEIIVPEATTNLPTNPSFETNTTGWTTGGANTIAQSSTQSRYGAYSLLCTYQNNTNLATFANLTLTAAAHTLSGWAYLPTAYDGAQPELRVEGYAGVTGTDRVELDLTIRDEWQRVTCTFTPDAGDLVGDVVLREAGAAGTPGVYIYIDAIQVEALGHVTTYCDGTQLGCEWNGTAHGSTSTRSALSRAGGRVYDLDDDSGFEVTNYIDSGVAPLTQHLDEYAIIPGGEVSSYKVHPRVLTLAGFMHSQTGFADLHDQIQGLIDILKPDAVPNNQPVLLRYNAATVEKEIAVYYEAGMEGNYQARFCAQQRFAIRFLAADPFWYEIGESGAVLDTNDSATLRYLAGRLRSTGQWSTLGITNNPTTDGVIYDVLVAKNSDGSVYFGGMFDGINNNTPAGADNCVRYDPYAGTWNLLVGASDIPFTTGVEFVRCLSEGPDGMIYIGGTFNGAGVNGVGTADYIVGYDPFTDTWFSLGDPDSGTAAITSVTDMAWDSAGNLYIVGNFTNFANVANADYVAVWDGTAWAAVGGVATGGTGTVSAIAIDGSDNIYIGGNFLNWNADGDADYWAMWDGSAWAAVNDIALVAAVSGMAMDDADNLYVVGSFDDTGITDGANRVFIWNGQAIIPLDTGLDAAAQRAHIAPDGLVWITGQFTVAGSVTGLNGVVVWNGSAFLPPDIMLSGAPSIVYGIDFSRPDPVVGNIYDTYIGFSTTGACYFSGSATITNDGSSEAYPQIKITRAGGTSAQLIQIRNEDTGKTLYFAYNLVDGETLTINLDPQYKSVTSSFYGNRREAMLAGSDFGEFALQSGANQITAFVHVAGAPTITATVVYQDKYWSLD